MNVERSKKIVENYKEKPVGGDCKTVKKNNEGNEGNRTKSKETKRLEKKQLENPAKNLKLETNGSDNNGTTTVTNDKETEQNVNRNLEKNEKNNTEETKEKSVKMLKNEKNQRQIGPREKHRIINEEHRIINTTND